MNNWTPKTDEIRGDYSEGDVKREERFDRWLAAHDAEIRADEREQAAMRVEDFLRTDLNCCSFDWWEPEDGASHSAIEHVKAAARGEDAK